MQLRLPIHSYSLRSTPASTARLVNCYTEQLPPDAKTPVLLTRAPGITGLATPGNGPVRGMHTFDGDAFVVSGTELYRVDYAGTETLIGTIPGTGAVSMDHNRDALVIVTNPDAYYTDGATITQITDVDFTSRGAKYVRFIDNYMLFMEPNSDRFFGATVATVDDFDALDFASAEANPDDLVGFEVDHRQVILLGEKSLEIWENTGAAGFPFERAINGFAEKGCLNGDTVAKLDNSIFWAADDYTVRRLTGITPQRVSTHAIEQFLSTVDTSSLWAFSYDQDGHFFYVLGSSDGCKVFDVTTNEWHDRETYPYNYFEWRHHCVAHGRQYVGNAYSNAVGYFSPTDYDENGGIQRMAWQYQPVYAEGRNATHDRLEIIAEMGVGLTLGQGSDPEIMCDYSDDGGITWATLPNRKMGQIGQYQWRAFWNGLGMSPQRVYRMAISDPVKVVITDTLLNVRGGRL